VVTLILSQSRSPLTGFLVGSVLVLFLSRRIGVIALVLLLIPALLSLTSFGDLFWEFFRRGQSTKYFESLSGRTTGWEIGWALFKERPFIGYGAYAGTRFAQFNVIVSSGSSVLNTWLEVLVGSGLIGLTPLVLAFLRIWMVLLHHSVSLRPGTLTQRLVVEAIGVLAIVSVRTIFTVELVWHPPLTFLLIVGYAELLRRAYKEKISEASYSSVITQPVVNVSS
jgi:O-antigen ligase